MKPSFFKSFILLVLILSNLKNIKGILYHYIRNVTYLRTFTYISMLFTKFRPTWVVLSILCDLEKISK